VNLDCSIQEYIHILFSPPHIGNGTSISVSIDIGPADTNATVGDIVPCVCKYTGTDDLPLWRINGVIHSPSALPPGYMANTTGLYFQAFQDLHMSTYQCLFTLYNGTAQNIQTVESTIGTVLIMQGQL